MIKGFFQRTGNNAQPSHNSLGQTEMMVKFLQLLTIYDIRRHAYIGYPLHRKNFIRIPHYIAYHTNHPAGTARGGTAFLIKGTIKNHQLCNYEQDFLQTTSVTIEDTASLLTISAVCLPSTQ
jgi:hypothetical protein